MKPALKLDVMLVHFPYSGNGGCSSEIPQIRQWELQTVLKMKKDERIGEVYTKDFSDTPITLTRNAAVVCARQHGAHLMLMVDSDNDPLRHAGEAWHKDFWDEAFNFVYKNYLKGPHVVGAPYCGPPNGIENVYVFHWESYHNRGQESMFKLEQYSRHQASMMSGIQECAALPTGMILYDMRAFDLIEPESVTKRSILEDVQTGRRTIDQGLMALREGWFSYEWTDQRAFQKASTEDVVNTRDIALAGMAKLGYNPIHCAWDSWVGHMKPMNVGRPQEFKSEQISETFKKAVLEDRRGDERIIDVSSLNQGDDPWSRRLRGLAADALRNYVPHNGNGHAPTNGKPKLECHHWGAWDKITDRLNWLAHGLVVEVGPGNKPFPAAKEYVGRKHGSIQDGKQFHEIDLNTDRLPYADKSVDFLYSRHTLEDLENPEHLLREIARVAKAGYIETPSPIAECCRGVNSGDNPHHNERGYAHHRSFVWTDGETLHVLPKLPSVEHLELPEHYDLLNKGPLHWNTCHYWTGDIKYKLLRHEIDFKMATDGDYEKLIRGGVQQSINTLPAFETWLEQREWNEYGHACSEHVSELWGQVTQLYGELRRNPRVLEVGSWLGTTAVAMADAGAIVHCVDTWQGSPTDITCDLVNEAGGTANVFLEFTKRCGERYNKTIFAHQRDSQRAARMHWEPFDIIFIDADHSYESTKADILAWWKHLRDDGVMIGHDYMTQQFPGVIQAVKELFGDKLEEIGRCSAGAMWKVRKSDFPNLEHEHGRQAVTANAH